MPTNLPRTIPRTGRSICCWSTCRSRRVSSFFRNEISTAAGEIPRRLWTRHSDRSSICNLRMHIFLLKKNGNRPLNYFSHLPCDISSKMFWLTILSRAFAACNILLVTATASIWAFFFGSSFFGCVNGSFLSFSFSRCWWAWSSYFQKINYTT